MARRPKLTQEIADEAIRLKTDGLERSRSSMPGGDAALLVDACGVSEPYFDALSEAGIGTAHIDDGFCYWTGCHAWMRPSFDVVIDCRFGADERAF
ncbi:hypothetical protein [uncultured Slackia sp.]|uniref:hypothetical protein n=1 Tax=uncultured Slackia sp. TaxID=665903 RepID=UPI0025ED5C73|nr:hypothetical protein [uncultured Slackia sp.]